MPCMAAAIRRCNLIKTDDSACVAFIHDVKVAPELNSCLLGEVVYIIL